MAVSALERCRRVCNDKRCVALRLLLLLLLPSLFAFRFFPLAALADKLAVLRIKQVEARAGAHTQSRLQSGHRQRRRQPRRALAKQRAAAQPQRRRRRHKVAQRAARGRDGSVGAARAGRRGGQLAQRLALGRVLRAGAGRVARKLRDEAAGGSARSCGASDGRTNRTLRTVLSPEPE